MKRGMYCSKAPFPASEPPATPLPPTHPREAGSVVGTQPAQHPTVEVAIGRKAATPL